MKKSAILAGFLAAVPLAVMTMQHTVHAIELSDFTLGDIAINNQFIEQAKAVVEAGQTGKVLAASVEDTTEESVNKEPKHVIATVKKGDTLSKIAKKYNTTYRRLFDANTIIKDPNIINPGDRIRIPEKDEKLKSRPLPVASPKATETGTKRSTHTQTLVATNAPQVASGSVWDRLAACESGGNWAINTGNGYYGGLQFSAATWRAVGGTGLPHQHSRDEQIKRGKILQARSGWGQWPACSLKLGLR